MLGFGLPMRLIGQNTLQRKNKTTIMQTEKEQRFKDLVHRNRDMLWHVCRDYRLSAAWTVDDAFQEVLCSLWRDIGQYKGASSERTWVYRVAINTMNSLKRKKSNQPPAEPPASGIEAYKPSDLRDLEQLIENLGEPDATILRASIDGFDYAEIAEITKLSVGAVGMRLTRAKERIKKIYQS